MFIQTIPLEVRFFSTAPAQHRHGNALFNVDFHSGILPLADFLCDITIS